MQVAGYKWSCLVLALQLRRTNSLNSHSLDACCGVCSTIYAASMSKTTTTFGHELGGLIDYLDTHAPHHSNLSHHMKPSMALTAAAGSTQPRCSELSDTSNVRRRVDEPHLKTRNPPCAAPASAIYPELIAPALLLSSSGLDTQGKATQIMRVAWPWLSIECSGQIGEIAESRTSCNGTNSTLFFCRCQSHC